MGGIGLPDRRATVSPLPEVPVTASAVPASADLMDLSMYVEDREMDVLDGLRATDPVHWNPASAYGPDDQL